MSFQYLDVLYVLSLIAVAWTICVPPKDYVNSLLRNCWRRGMESFEKTEVYSMRDHSLLLFESVMDHIVAETFPVTTRFSYVSGIYSQICNRDLSMTNIHICMRLGRTKILPYTGMWIERKKSAASYVD